MTQDALKIQVLVRGGWNTTYTISEANLGTLINRAHLFCAGYKKWPDTEGRASTTYASLVTNEDGWITGVYPEGWKADTIRQLLISGKRYKKLNFEDFQIFKEVSPSSTDRVFANHGFNYYVSGDQSGSVVAWGQYTPDTLGTEIGTTVFDGRNTEGDEAVIDMSMSYVHHSLGEKDQAAFREKNARQILEELWQRLQDEAFAEQTAEQRGGMFERFDLLDGRRYSDEIKRDQF